ncbi:MAG: hypothetical protein AMJ53_04120 [Gammaproteobacteria bacterium SG8_11]|nr:MAG: hypothetical protein AMJ53_04120 [Gammaproteobacteria bacterium SG8_11]
MKKIVLLVYLVATFLVGCSSVPVDDITIESEADPKIKFSGYKTYAWLGAAGILNDPQGQWEPPKFDADAEIMFLIDQALRKRGMTEVNENPDMLVAYALGVDMEALKLKQDPDTKMQTLEQVPQGGFIVVLIDPETEYATWVSVATAELKGLEPDAAKQRLKYAVNKMFAELPKK